MMLNIEKYAEEIKKEMADKFIAIACAAHNVKQSVDGCSNDEICLTCRAKMLDWLISEIKEECHTCKHHGRIEGSESVFACLHEGQVLEKSDDVACEFWEV